jgi:hypothetical protein
MALRGSGQTAATTAIYFDNETTEMSSIIDLIRFFDLYILIAIVLSFFSHGAGIISLGCI